MPKSNRTFPHVQEIKDLAAKASIQKNWDKTHAQQETIESLQSQIDSLQTAMTSLQETVNKLMVQVNQALSNAGTQS